MPGLENSQPDHQQTAALEQQGPEPAVMRRVDVLVLAVLFCRGDDGGLLCWRALLRPGNDTVAQRLAELGRTIT